MFFELATLLVVRAIMSFNLAKKEKNFLYPLVLLAIVDKASNMLSVVREICTQLITISSIEHARRIDTSGRQSLSDLDECL